MDSWEDDDVDVTLPGAAPPTPATAGAWDDEEDEVEVTARPPPAPAADAAPVAEVDPDAVVLKLENMADHLKRFAATVSSTRVEEKPPRLVPTLMDKFKEKKSKDNHIFMFVKELLKQCEDKFGAGDCNDLIILLTNMKLAKEKIEAKPTESKKEQKKKKKSKKEKLEEKKKVDDLFGAAAEGEYDHYEDQYDDFF